MQGDAEPNAAVWLADSKRQRFKVFQDRLGTGHSIRERWRHDVMKWVA
jgi:hypothetical protein